MALVGQRKRADEANKRAQSGTIARRPSSDRWRRATYIDNSHTDQLNMTMFATAYINCWLALRFEGLGTFLILSVTLAAILYPPGKISRSCWSHPVVHHVDAEHHDLDGASVY